MKRTITVMILGLVLAGCSVGVSRTPGMNLFSAGDYDSAIPLLQQEIADGDVSARYSLGLAYRDGLGVPADPVQAEILLTGAAVGGDPRAITAVRELLDENICPNDGELRSAWGNLATWNRNLITGVVELNNAPRATLRQMADIYEEPCTERPAQPEAAASLRAFSNGARRIWIYVPG